MENFPMMVSVHQFNGFADAFDLSVIGAVPVAGGVRPFDLAAWQKL